MGVFKEEIIFLEDLAKRQGRIWDDSCDYGIKFSDLSPMEVNGMRRVITRLLKLEGSEVVWKMDRPAVQRQYKLVVMWGRSDHGMFDASIAYVNYYKGHDKHFFGIEVKSKQVDSKGKEI